MDGPGTFTYPSDGWHSRSHARGRGRQSVLRLTCVATAVVALTAGASYAQQAAAPAQADPATADDVFLSARDLVIDEEDSIYTAQGNVEVRVEGRVLRADRVIYDLSNQSLRAQGNVQISDLDGSVQFADEIEMDDEFRNGFATRFSSRMPNNVLITAASAVRVEGVSNTLQNVVYTGCPICDDKNGETPTWALRARRAEQNSETQMVTYEDAVLEIAGVPVLYVPYFAHPDPNSKRRSGLLVPDAGYSSRLGAFYEQPYYWAISPSQDLTVSPLLMTDVNPLLKLNYRKRFFSGEMELDGSFTYGPDFDSDGEKFGEERWRSHLYGQGLFDINQDWQWGFGVETQTDDLYDSRYDINDEDRLRGLYASQRRQLLNQLYVTGQNTDYYVESGLLGFQGLREFDIDGQIPKVAPTLFAEKVYDFGSYGQVAANLSGAALFRDEAQTLPNGDIVKDTARATTSVQWDSQYILGMGMVFEPFAFGRADVYRIDNGTDDAVTPSRLLGLAGGTARMPFIRRGENVDIIVEPVVMAAYGSDQANDMEIPNEDSLVFEVDDGNIFRPNPNSAYDLWQGGARAAAGLNVSARWRNNMQLSGMIGRRWQENADPQFTQLSNLSGTTSDYIATAKAEFGDPLRLDARVRFDDDFTFNRIDAGLTTNVWRLQGSARYFQVASNSAGQPDEGLVLDAGFKLTSRWSAIVRDQRDIAADRDIRFGIGFRYLDDCSYFEILYERVGTIDRTIGPSENIGFRFALTGLGGGGDN